jgi:hypothetical protein
MPHFLVIVNAAHCEMKIVSRARVPRHHLGQVLVVLAKHAGPGADTGLGAAGARMGRGMSMSALVAMALVFAVAFMAFMAFMAFVLAVAAAARLMPGRPVRRRRRGIIIIAALRRAGASDGPE